MPIAIIFDHYILIFACLLFISILAGKISYKLGVPVLLLFLLVGMIAGSKVPLTNFDGAKDIGTVALCIILFSGGLDTRYSEIKPVIRQGIILSTLGVVLTAFAMGALIFLLVDNFFPDLRLTFLESLLLASVMSSTDSASVFSILRSKSLSLKHNLRPLLELESGSNDPIAYMLTIVLIGILKGETIGFWSIVGTFVLQFVVGIIGGFLLGKFYVKIINRINVQYDSLYPILLLAGALFIFSSTTLAKGNGFLAVYIGGLVIGNSRFVHKRTTKDFFDGMTWLMQIVMFLTLGLLVNPSELLPIVGAGLLMAFGLIFFARPIAVILCLLPFKKMMNKDRAYISWVGLRGAVPIIFAIFPMVYDVPHAKTMFTIVFFITLVSLLVQGTSLSWIADKLKLTNKIHVRKQLQYFDVAFSEDVKSIMTEMNVSEDLLVHGNCIMNLPIPEHCLVVMIKRGSKYILPKGNTPLQEDDKLLVLTDDEGTLIELHEALNFDG